MEAEVQLPDNSTFPLCGPPGRGFGSSGSPANRVDACGLEAKNDELVASSDGKQRTSCRLIGRGETGNGGEGVLLAWRR